MGSSRKPLLVAAFVATVIAVPALAQQPPSSYPAPCEASRVSKSDVERAHTVFLSGKQYLEESNYDKAIGYFKDAYSIDCSIHAILPIIATAYERKGDRGEAVRALEEYQKRSPSAPDHEVMDRRIRNLKDQLSREQPTATATTATASASAPPTSATSVPTASAGASASGVTSAATPPPAAPEGGHSAGPWVLVGVGGAAAVAGVVALVVGAGDVSSAASACGPQHKCPAGQMSQVSTGNTGLTLETAGGWMLGLGAAAAAAGLIWHFVEAPSAPAVGATRVTPVVAPGYAGVTVGSPF